MKRKVKILMAAVTVALAAGCASTGGGHGSGATPSGQTRTPEEALACLITLGFFCPPPHQTTNTQSSGSGASSSTSTNSSSSIGSRQSAASSQSVPGPSAPATFESWSTEPANVAREARGQLGSVLFKGRVDSVSEPFGGYWGLGMVRYEYDSAGKLIYFSSVYGTERKDLSDVGHAEIDVRYDRLFDNWQQSPFTSVSARQVGLIANPYVLGWDYQSFDAWDDQGTDIGIMYGQTFGAATPASAVPLSGTASFVGKLGGLYVSPAGEGSIAAGDVTVNADFSARSLSLTSSGTIITRDFTAATTAPNLDLRGTLTYAPGANAFSGTLTNAGGTMSGPSQGQFYGPAAEELGGVFVVKSPTTVETYTGAYGAKR
jgi:hypothetical protein